MLSDNQLSENQGAHHRRTVQLGLRPILMQEFPVHQKL